MSTTQSKYSRRFDEEFKREIAALKKLYGQGGRWQLPPPASTFKGLNGAKTLERENADLREQRAIQKKSGRHCLETPARRHGVISELAGEFPVKSLRRALGVGRSGYYDAARKKAERPRARENMRLAWRVASWRFSLIAPHRRGRKKPKTQDGRGLRRYRRRWKIERLLAWLQNFRRILARHERKAENYPGFVHLGCIKILLRQYL